MQFSYEVRNAESDVEGYDLFLKDSDDETVMQMEINYYLPETSVENLKLFQDQCVSAFFEKPRYVEFQTSGNQGPVSIVQYANKYEFSCGTSEGSAEMRVFCKRTEQNNKTMAKFVNLVLTLGSRYKYLFGDIALSN